MNRTRKEEFVGELQGRLERAAVVYLTDFTGLDVKAMTELRQKVKDSGGEYLVVKNRLARLAFAELDGLPDLGEALTGPTGFVLGYGEVVEPARAITDFAKEHEDRPSLKIGLLDNRIIDQAQIQRLAKLPPREQLLAELAGAFEAPLQALAGALQAKLQEVVGLLEALKEKGSES